MGKRSAIAALIGAALLVWVGASNGQVFPAPTAGSGVVTVTGKVDVDNVVQVAAAQRGEWRVAVANVPDVRVSNTPTVAPAALPFVRAGVRLVVTWPTGDRETIRIVQPAGGGWARVESTGGVRWLNLEGARAVDEVQ
jgi:hypothetical protein